MEKAPISVVVITKNEEKRLPDCLESVKWANEIVILDDESTDGTLNIAKNYGAKTATRHMENEGIHRNHANSLATQPWVMNIDADERVSPELAASIQEMTSRDHDSNVCYAVAMKQYIGDQWIQGAGYYPAFRTKIFKNGQLKYRDEKVHPPVSYEGSCGRLTGDLIHHTSPNFTHWVSKFNRETSFEAEKWILKNRKVSAPGVLRKAASRFLKFYFQKGGIKHGFTGFIMSLFHSLYQLITYMKYLEMKRNGKTNA